MVFPLLAIDDDPNAHELLRQMCSTPNCPYRLMHAQDPNTAMEMARAQAFPVALVDLHFANGEAGGFALLESLRQLDPAMELLVLSSSKNFEDVRRAMRAGASDYLPKGFGREELFHALERALAKRRWRKIESGSRLRAKREDAGMIGNSLPMIALREKIAKFAPVAASVLIEGETGVGKELVAASLHSGGVDAAAPFVAVNCAALPASTIDSFFFGHERGAFTGAEAARGGVIEEADGGTLFLDEVNSLPLELQGRLLRVLEERKVRRLGGRREIEVNFRLLSAANQPLEPQVKRGDFREDLLYRLSVLRINVPPLRERSGDIPLLARHFLPRRLLETALMQALESHSWPGNVRELRNLLFAMDVLADADECLGVEQLPENAVRALAAPLVEVHESEDINAFADEQAERAREFLVRAYRGAGGNVSKLARLLAQDRSHLHQKLVALGIHRPKK